MPNWLICGLISNYGENPMGWMVQSYFDGRLDEIRVYGDALTIGEVRYLMSH